MRRILAVCGCVLAVFLIAPSLDHASSLGAQSQVEQDGPHYYIIGEVKRAGTYPLKDKTTVGQAIDDANGLTERASLGEAIIGRLVNGNKVKIPVTIHDTVLDKDTIYIPRSVFR